MKIIARDLICTSYLKGNSNFNIVPLKEACVNLYNNELTVAGY